LSCYLNTLNKKMTDVEKKETMKEKTYVGTGWTQKPEYFKLDKSQLTSDELKKTISENNSVKAQAIVMQGGKNLVTKEVGATLTAAKEKHGEKFRPELEKLVADNMKQDKKKGKGLGV